MFLTVFFKLMPLEQPLADRKRFINYLKITTSFHCKITGYKIESF